MKVLLACLFALISVHPLSSATLDLHHSKAELPGPAERELAKDCIDAWEDANTTAGEYEIAVVPHPKTQLTLKKTPIF